RSRRASRHRRARGPPRLADAVPEPDLGYGESHGYGPAHGGPTGPGDAPATEPAAEKEAGERGAHPASSPHPEPQSHVDTPEHGTWAATLSSNGHGRAAERSEGGRERVMSILLWVLFGLIVGVIAKLLTPGREPGGFVAAALLGIAGALVGGFIGRVIGL